MIMPLILPCLPYAVTKRVDVAFLTLFTSSSDLMKSIISVPLGLFDVAIASSMCTLCLNGIGLQAQ